MKKLLTLALAAAMALSLTACGGGNGGSGGTSAGTPSGGSAGGSAAAPSGGSSGQTYELKLSTNLADDHIACQGYYGLAEAVEAATDGQVTIVVYPGEQMGKESDVTSSVSMHANTTDIVTCGPAELSKYNPAFSLFDAPYIFSSSDSMVAFANSDDIQPLYDELAASSNLRVLGMYYYGSREVTVKGYAATNPDGLKGCKLRVPDAEIALAYGEALGATPTVMSLGEVYMGIQQGVVDGQENPLPTINANAFYEVCDNLLMTDHVIAAVTITIDDQTWQTMPADLQEKVLTCVQDTCNKITDDIQAQEAELKTAMAEHGMNVVEVDKEAFKANCAPIYEKYAGTWGEWYDVAQKF